MDEIHLEEGTDFSEPAEAAHSQEQHTLSDLPIRLSTIPRLIIEARSRRSRRQERTDGLLPWIVFCCSSPTPGSATETASTCAVALEMLKLIASPTASSATGDQAGLDHAIVFGDLGGGLRDVLAIGNREVTGHDMIGKVVHADT